MFLFLTMNASDYWLQQHPEGQSYYTQAGHFPISSLFTPLFDGMSYATVVTIERTSWWLHIIGILAFLNYLYYSKHLHIILAFPNTFYANLNPLGRFSHSEAVANEVKLMMDPSADPYASPAIESEPISFGAADVKDLNRIQLMNAYSCTECGRCTDVCPANQTGKKLSPRKIMMDTRDRLVEVGRNIDANKGTFVDDGNLESSLREFPCAAQADRTCTDDRNGFAHRFLQSHNAELLRTESNAKKKSSCSLPVSRLFCLWDCSRWRSSRSVSMSSLASSSATVWFMFTRFRRVSGST